MRQGPPGCGVVVARIVPARPVVLGFLAPLPACVSRVH